MLTEEQSSVVYAHGNCKVVAVAGSGKSHTLYNYAKIRPNKKGLYLVYNASNRSEAAGKAKSMGLNLNVQTAHSLARGGLKRKFKVFKGNVPLELIINLCGIQKGSVHERYSFAQMISDGLHAACNRMDGNIYHSDFKDFDEGLVKKMFSPTIDCVRWLLKEMAVGTIPCTHDFYLKVYAKQNPMLGYDYILFDEGQDANEVMLDVFLKQRKPVKVIVGDPAQQIYSWRGAVNALNKVNFPQYALTGSFRFGEDVARMANYVLRWKKYIGVKGGVECRGLREDAHLVDGGTGYLCRSTVGLFKKMVEVYIESQPKFFIEGGKQGNKFFASGKLMSDVYFLFAQKKNRISSELIGSFDHISELYEFAKNTGNRDVKSLVELIFTYKSEVFEYKKLMMGNIVTKKEEADVFFSTVHKAKGQEYPFVELDDTFIKLQDVKLLNEAIHNEQTSIGGLSEPMKLAIQEMNEEINILYVAITRAMNKTTAVF